MQSLTMTWAGLMLMFALSACSTLQQSEATAKLAVTYATLKTIDAGGDQIARAKEVTAIASDAKCFLDGESVTVALLEQAVRDRLPPDLSAADRLLADALIDAVVTELEARVGDGLVLPEQRLAVNQVLDWIIDAASVFGV